MGCAEGAFHPTEAFQKFLENEPPQIHEIPEFEMWNELSLVTAAGEIITCAGTVLSRVDFGDEIEVFVTALGIGYPTYEELFPEHVAAYENQFKPG